MLARFPRSWNSQGPIQHLRQAHQHDDGEDLHHETHPGHDRDQEAGATRDSSGHMGFEPDSVTPAGTLLEPSI